MIQCSMGPLSQTWEESSVTSATTHTLAFLFGGPVSLCYDGRGARTTRCDPSALVDRSSWTYCVHGAKLVERSLWGMVRPSLCGKLGGSSSRGLFISHMGCGSSTAKRRGSSLEVTCLPRVSMAIGSEVFGINPLAWVLSQRGQFCDLKCMCCAICTRIHNCRQERSIQASFNA